MENSQEKSRITISNSLEIYSLTLLTCMTLDNIRFRQNGHYIQFKAVWICHHNPVAGKHNIF